MNMKTTVRVLSLVAVASILTGCETTREGNGITDGGYDGGPLADGVANIWVDPDGCQHWYIDDGLEGYMSPRLHRDGTPYCQEERGAIVLKDGSTMMAEGEPARPNS